MCSTQNSSLPGLLYQLSVFHSLQVTYAAQVAHNWLTLLSGQPQQKQFRTPLLRLQNQMRKLTPPPPSNGPRHTVYLVKSPG
jgi:hypothetical protein